ncbi:MAG TPA: non-homologous end-joining DNA ligase [Thermoleophilaceae bacterium]|jgi:bifunctional non-homologous end joining protein LigD
MAATLTDERFDDPDWIFERKLDGIRCLAYRDSRGVRLVSRNNLSLDGRFPDVARALAAQGGGPLLLDGEVVAFAGSRTSFARLADRRRRGRVPVFLYAFDVLFAGGRDVTGLPLLERKAVLRGALRPGGPLRLTPYRRREGRRLYAEACRRGWEGLIAKRADSTYVQARSRDWLKWKCESQQELVVGGWTEPKGSRAGLGALLVGHWEDGRLRYAGKVGTGFDRETLLELAGRLRELQRAESPFADAGRVRASWAEPRLVAQVAFTEWTRDGRLRHPRFLGLREDKDPRDVVRERPS